MKKTASAISASRPPFAIKSSRVVTPKGEIAAAIVVEGGTIKQIVDANQLPDGITCTDFGNLVISPGLIDAHVHINDPGTDWEGFESATAAAAAGGITTLIDMPLNSIPVTTSVAALQSKRAAATEKLHVDVGFHAGIVPRNDSQLPWLIEQGVLGFKAFLCDSGLDEFPAAGEKELRSALEFLKPRGIPLLAHAEIVTAVETYGANDPSSYQQYVNSRPPEFELAAIKLLINLCREYQSPVHIVHLATAEALPMIEAAKREGLPLTVETCPHYLFFSAVNVVHGDTRFKCAPPIRNEANRLALCEAVASGLIDTIGSDHSPCPPELKQLDSGDFTKAWGGIAGLQLTLPVTWMVGKDFDLTLTKLAELTATRPAEIFGLSNRKGKIAVGCDADLVVWNPEDKFRVDPKGLFHRHSVCPYQSCSLQGTVTNTFVRGNLVFDHAREPQHSSASGNLLTHSASKVDSVAEHLDSLMPAALYSTLESCCASREWVRHMMSPGELKDDANVLDRAEEASRKLNESDWLEAFTAHPRIGNVDSLRKKYANTKATAGAEQAGVASADEATLKRLAAANDEYFEKFGFIFIVYATGKSAAEMLSILEQRLPNDRASEIANAASEQQTITLLRLRKLVP